MPRQTTKSPAALENVGDSYRDVEVTRVVEIAEIQVTVRELIHLPTGATFLHVANDDPENLFYLIGMPQALHDLKVVKSLSRPTSVVSSCSDRRASIWSALS